MLFGLRWVSNSSLIIAHAFYHPNTQIWWAHSSLGNDAVVRNRLSLVEKSTSITFSPLIQLAKMISMCIFFTRHIKRTQINTMKALVTSDRVDETHWLRILSITIRRARHNWNFLIKNPSLRERDASTCRSLSQTHMDAVVCSRHMRTLSSPEGQARRCSRSGVTAF